MHRSAIADGQMLVRGDQVCFDVPGLAISDAKRNHDPHLATPGGEDDEIIETVPDGVPHQVFVNLHTLCFGR